MSTVSVLEDISLPIVTRKMSVGELKALSFMKAKERFTNPPACIDILNYIDFMAQNNSVSGDDVELPYLDLSEKQEFSLSKAEVTRLFFSHLETKAEEIRKNVIIPDDHVVEKLKEAIAIKRDAAAQEREETVRNHIRAANDYASSMQSELNSARHVKAEIEGLRDQSFDFITPLLEGLRHTNWNFKDYDNYSDTISFINRGDVTIRYHAPKAGINYEINCGKYVVKFNTDTMEPRLYTGEGCVSPTRGDGTHWHPHVNSNGKICFGNGQATVNQAIVDGDIVTILKTLDAMLSNYGESPYQLITDFSKSAVKRDERVRREHEEKKKKEAALAAGIGSIDDEFLDHDGPLIDELEFPSEPTESTYDSEDEPEEEEEPDDNEPEDDSDESEREDE